MNKDFVQHSINTQGMLPLYYHADPEVTIAVAKALYRAGVRVIEYTNRGEKAIQNFTLLKAERDHSMPGLILGVGTIKSDEDARNFLGLGADFLISPGILPSIGILAEEESKLWIPGCMTVTEIILAEKLGAPIVKLFPADILGPSYVSAIKDIFPSLLFMPTGGVDTTKENLQAWFAAGVCSVGMGSKLISKQLLEKENYKKIERDAADVLSLIQDIREHEN